MSCTNATISAAAHSLDELPLLVLENISEHLSQCNGGPRHLAALALTSRPLAAASASQRFRRILVEPRGRDDLPRITDRLLSILAPDRLKHARELIFDTNYSEHEYLRKAHRAARDGGSTWPFHPPVPTCPLTYCLGVLTRGDMTSETTPLMDQQWAPLIRLIDSMPGLVMLRWVSEANLIPPSLLRALGHRHPAIKLDVFNLDLHGLRQHSCAKPPGQRLSSEERALAVSRSLDSVNICDYCEYDSEGCCNYHAEAVMDMARLGSLRHVAVFRRGPSNTIELQRFCEHGSSVPRCWLGLNGSSESQLYTSPLQQQDRGRLESLVLLKSNGFYGFPKWMQCTDLSTLGRLEISDARLETLQLLESNSHLFAALDSLHIYIDDSDGRRNEPESFDKELQALGRVFRALRPLRHLKLTDLEASVLFVDDAILDRHGPWLRSLYLGSRWACHSLKPQDVERISATCRRLQRFEVVLPRSQSNAAEMALYRALGRLPFLEAVTLYLACWPSAFTEADADRIQYDGLTPAEYRPAVENAAVDAELAKAIFGVLTTAQAAETGLPYGSLPLDRVRLIPLVQTPDVHGWQIGDMDIETIMSVLGRAWVCERRMNGVDVQAESEEPEREQRRLLKEHGNGLEWLRDPAFCGVWSMIWGDAGVNGSVRWTDTWWSTPLST